MDSSNKKTLFGLVIFLIIGGIAAAVYWQKPYLPSGEEEPSLSPKEKCLEDISKMDEEELIAAVENFDYEDISSASVREAKKVLVIKQLFKYLTCEIKTRMRIEDEENEELYLMTKEFVERNTSEINREEALALLDEIYSEEVYYPTADYYIYFLALMPLEAICDGDQVKDSFLELDLKYLDPNNELSQEIKEERIGKTRKICQIINRYSDDSSSFIEKEIINDWSDNELILEREILARTALAFRLDGEGLALEICASLPGSKISFMEICRDSVSYLLYLAKCEILENGQIKSCPDEKPECRKIKEGLANSVCFID